MAVPTEIRQRVIALLEQLPGESLIKAVEFLEAPFSRSFTSIRSTKPPHQRSRFASNYSTVFVSQRTR